MKKLLRRLTKKHFLEIQLEEIKFCVVFISSLFLANKNSFGSNYCHDHDIAITIIMTMLMIISLGNSVKTECLNLGLLIASLSRLTNLNSPKKLFVDLNALHWFTFHLGMKIMLHSFILLFLLLSKGD